MAEPTEPGPVSVDPELAANLTRLLDIRGPMGLLKVLDTIVPVVSLGNVVQPTIQVLTPSYRSTDVFSNGVLVAAAANTVHADTGALADGTYDVILYTYGEERKEMAIQHRNAANAATLMTFSYIQGGDAPGIQTLAFGYELALNERLRILNIGAFGGGINSVATLFARVRA